MSDVVIHAEGLGKKYIIGHQGESERYTSLRDVVARGARSLVRSVQELVGGKLPVLGEETTEDFWALKDVNFEIKRGEVVGIIGRNGAGKSTLLKILSRITEPTEGRVEIKGRVASLLEVGTGFHPELTGRENIYLNGAILGMSRAEIRRKFDEIVDFAEVEKFLDTPVKRYSSGMYVRLAFAVAAHLEPEILVVDEVLAVGDAEFQKKCLGKMRDVAGYGRTVLFVSHNMNAVEKLCTRVIALKAGSKVNDSRNVREAIHRQQTSPDVNNQSGTWTNRKNDFDHSVCKPISIEVINREGILIIGEIDNREQVTVRICAEIKKFDPTIKIGFSLFDENSQLILSSFTTDRSEGEWPDVRPGIVEFQCDLPRHFLNEGTYRIELHISLHNREWIVRPEHDAPTINFSIRGGLSDSPHWLAARAGVLAPVWHWAVRVV